MVCENLCGITGRHYVRGRLVVRGWFRKDVGLLWEWKGGEGSIERAFCGWGFFQFNVSFRRCQQKGHPRWVS